MQKKTYLEALRGLAIFAVVAVHAVSRSVYGLDAANPIFRNGSMLIQMGRWAVPVFIMISGAVFLGREPDLKKMWGKYIPRIAGAYLFWSLIYSVAVMAPQYYDRVTLSALCDVLVWTLKGGSAHLWYLWLLLALYMLTPILQILVKNASQTMLRYLIGMGIVVTFLIPVLEELPLVGYVLEDNWEILDSGFWGGYVFYFLLGHYLDQENIDKKQNRVLYVLGLLGITGSAAVVWLSPERQEPLVQALSGNLSPCVMVASAALFVAAKRRELPGAKIMKKLAPWSFGIYLTHNLFLDIVGTKLIKVLNLYVHSLVIASILIICTLIFSIGITALIQRMKPVGMVLT